MRHCDDFVVMCRTKKDCEQAQARIRVILERLGLELHPDKTRRIDVDAHVVRRLRSLRIKRKGRHLRAGEADGWWREYFEHLGLHRLRGGICYPVRAFWQENA